MKNVNWKDVWNRALKTFVQAAFSYLITCFSNMNPFDGQMDNMAWFGLALSTGAAGLSAVWNGVLQPLFQKYKPPEE